MTAGGLGRWFRVLRGVRKKLEAVIFCGFGRLCSVTLGASIRRLSLYKRYGVQFSSRLVYYSLYSVNVSNTCSTASYTS